jgi:predicted dehydrogenase
MAVEPKHTKFDAPAHNKIVSLPESARVGVAVVGCGYWGPNIIRNLAAAKRADLKVVCDREEARLDDIHRRYPSVRLQTNFKDVLSDPTIGAVAICTPVHTHFELAKAALDAGKHVLIEKPLTHSTETAQTLVDLAIKNNRTLMVDHTFVYSGPVQKIKSIIDSGQIGEVLYFDSVRINLGLFQSDINVVWDLAPHDLSIMDFVLNRSPIWVSAIGSTHFGQLENLAYLTMKFDDSMIAHLHVNWLAPVKLRSTVIGGSKQMIVYDDLAPSEKIKVYDKGVSLNGHSENRAKALVDYRMGDMFAPRIDKTEPLESVCNGFLEAILDGKTPPTDGHAGLRVVRILEAAQRSIERNGERITL